MTPDQRQQLEAVVTEVRAIPYVDALGPGEDPDRYDDEPVKGFSFVCRMEAQRMATLLRLNGWPVEDLTEVLCYVETGERHAILGVQDGDDLWFADSRFPAPYQDGQQPAGYRGEARQVMGSDPPVFAPFKFSGEAIA